MHESGNDTRTYGYHPVFNTGMERQAGRNLARMGGENMKYTVTGHATVVCSMVVEANTEKEAIKKANEQFGSLANYTGMGGTDKMIGVPTSEDDRCIYPDSDVEFDDVLPFTE